MSYIRPTLSEFQAIYPQFASVTEPQFDYWIARAERVIGLEFGDDQLHATMLLTAHYLVMQGLGGGTDSQIVSEFAGASRIKSGTLELAWSDGAKARTTGSRYGDDVRALILSVKGGPGVTPTGRLLEGCGFRGFGGPLPPWVPW